MIISCHAFYGKKRCTKDFYEAPFCLIEDLSLSRIFHLVPKEYYFVKKKRNSATPVNNPMAFCM